MYVYVYDFVLSSFMITKYFIKERLKSAVDSLIILSFRKTQKLTDFF